MSRPGTRKSSILSRRSGASQRVTFFAKRAGLVALGIIVIGGVVWGLSANGFFTRAGESLHQSFVTRTASNGFVVKNILIEGRNNVSRDGLKTLININKNDPLYAQDLNELRDRIAGLSWVKNVTVERRLPDTLYISLEEREPIALWQRNGKLSVVDDEGIVLTEYNIQKFKNLLVVVGDEAPQNTRALLDILNHVPSIRARVDAAKWIGARRWDLTLNNKIILKLPADNPLESLQKLEALNATDAVLDKQLTSIDLREQGRIIVQTTPGNAAKIDGGATVEDKNI